jgi:hypothetical protein
MVGRFDVVQRDPENSHCFNGEHSSKRYSVSPSTIRF